MGWREYNIESSGQQTSQQTQVLTANSAIFHIYVWQQFILLNKFLFYENSPSYKLDINIKEVFYIRYSLHPKLDELVDFIHAL